MPRILWVSIVCLATLVVVPAVAGREHFFGERAPRDEP